MLPRFIVSLAFLLLVSVNCLGQGLITPRRAAVDQKRDAATEAAQPEPAGSASPAALPSALPVSAIKIKASIDGQIATVKVEHLFRNETDDVLEGTYYYPVPEGAILLEFAVYDGDERRVGRVKEKQEARAAYAEAAAQGEDPAILEMTKSGWFQSRVYPIAPRSEKRVEIVYSQILPIKDNIATFEYPLGRGYKKLKVPIGSVDIDLDVRSAVAIKNLFSPTHPLDLHYDGDRHVTSKLSTAGGDQAENFQLLYSLSDEEFGLSLVTYRKEGEDGYFLLMLSPKVDFDDDRISAKDVVFVIDISGSMEGDKLRQAKEALRFGLTKTLNEDDRFNIVAFSSAVRPISGGMMQATRANIEAALRFVDSLQSHGGTNINDALVTAMKMFQRSGRPQNLVFLTDGLPDRNIEPAQICANVRAANRANARLFTFGVGADVNRHLLEQLAAENRGAQANIENQYELARDVTTFFAKVSKPVLSDLAVNFGVVQADRTHPSVLPDLYTRSQIKIFGRYSNPVDIKNATITLAGRMNEQTRQFNFDGLNFPLATTDKDFLPRLWATERVNALLSEIRLNGEREQLKQEVIELAREFNLVTPYTSMYVPTAAEAAREKQDQANAAGTGNGVGRGSGPISVSGRNFAQTSQSPSGPGFVVDPTGAVIAGATVTIKDEKTGATRSVTTDSTGNYSVAGLPPGSYTVEVTAPGFKNTQVQNVVVQPGQVAAAAVTLSPGGVTEHVVVASSAAPLIDTSSTQISSTFDSSKIRELPSRSQVDSLARLTPGTTTIQSDGFTRQSTSVDEGKDQRLRFNGNRAQSNAFIINGIDNNDIDGRPAVSSNNFDTINSLFVTTTRGTGESSMTGASSINLITRSGTNEFHGTIFDYHLDRRLGALSPLERRAGLEREPDFKETLYGGTFGGPIRRDRLFFFGSFQGERARSDRFTNSTLSLLTPTTRGLADLASAFPDSPTVRDLILRGPLSSSFGGPVFQRSFKRFVLGVPIEFGDINRVIPSEARGYELSSRVDYNATNRDRLQFDYWYTSRNEANAIGRLAAGYTGATDGGSHLGGVQWNRMLSPRTVNDLSVGFNRSSLRLDPVSNVPSEEADSGSLMNPFGPGVSVGFRGLGYGASAFAPAAQASTSFKVSDALSHIIGRHNIKLGGQVRHRFTSFDYSPGLGGQFTYSSFEDFVANRPVSLAVAAGDSHSEFTELHHHYYFDDSWRVQSNLTLTLGLSYENAGHPVNDLADRIREREANPATALFSPDSPIQARTITTVDRDNNNLAPRFGFAYTPRFRVLGRNLFGYDKTVIRGGASLSYDQTNYRTLADVAASSPNLLLAVITPGAGPLTPSFPDAPGFDQLKSLFGARPERLARTELSGSFRTPFSTAWHLSATRDLNGKVLVELGYAGTRGTGLIRAVDANPVIDFLTASATGPRRVYESTGRSIYHSVQARLEAQFSDTIVGGMSYTFSKLIDDLPESTAQIAGGVGDRASFAAQALPTFAQNPFDTSRAERALSSLDRRHSFTANFVYSLPLHRGQNGVVGRLLGGWQASGIIEVASGSPFTPLQQIGYTPSSAAIFASAFSDRQGSVRPFSSNPFAPADAVAFSNAANLLHHFFTNPDGTPFQSATGFIIADHTGFREGILNEARFVYNDYSVEQAARARGLLPNAFGNTFAAGRPFGDVSRNSLVGPDHVNVDFAILKTTKLSEKVSLQFRAEFYNLFNHPNRAKPNFILENAGGYGFVDQGESDSDPRRVRLALKLIF
ncbi:MAG TPA: VIT domain-containing protein [Blastocatellia bacterium]|nr:VIT domain-containing protein [Blastocatellia bacterium]